MEPFSICVIAVFVATSVAVATEWKEQRYDELKPLLHQPKLERDGTIWSFCPVHEADGRHKRRSLSLDISGNLKCWAGCEFSILLDALGATRKRLDLFEGQSRPGNASVARNLPSPLDREQGIAPVAIYEYRETSGLLVARKARYEPARSKKRFNFAPGDREWFGSLEPLTEAELPLYRSERLKARPDEQVIYPEGEKAVEACEAHGLLAVTHVGGADQKDFGNALEVLRDRDVAFWSDNDRSGRQCIADMVARVKPIARSVSVISASIVASLPEKGDAWDYFELGGTVEALTVETPDEPRAWTTGEDGVAVRVPTGAGVIIFDFQEIEKHPRSFEAELTVTTLGKVRAALPYSQRHNLLSSSARTELRRELEGMHGREFDWPGSINTAFALCRQTFLQMDRALRVDAINDPGELHMLIDPILPAGDATLLHANGGTGKTYVGLALGLSLVLGVPLPGMGLRQQTGVLYVDYETNAETFRYRLGRLLRGLGHGSVPVLPYFYWRARGIPLCDQVDALRRKIASEGIGLVIVDSAAAACGGKPEDADITARYFNALARLGDGVTTLTIAHVAKHGDQQSAFGSVFWRNSPRRTWSLSRLPGTDASRVELVLACQKVNDGPTPSPLGLRLEFAEPNGPVRLETTAVPRTAEWEARRPMHQRIWDVLDHPMTAYAVAQAVTDDEAPSRESVKSVAQCLRDYHGKRFAKLEPQEGENPQPTWARLTRREEEYA